MSKNSGIIIIQGKGKNLTAMREESVFKQVS